MKDCIPPRARLGQLSRRKLLELARLTAGLAALSVVGLCGLSGPVLGQGDVPAGELMKPGPLPELVLGNRDAPITVVEYASMTCNRCADFHNSVLPKLKEKYIDNGKMRLVIREFPLDNRGGAASVLVRCAGDDKALPLMAALFAKQGEWAFMGGDARPQMFKIAQQAGFTQKRFDTCLADKKLLEKVSAVRDHAAKNFDVKATPTFFINGKRLNAQPTIEEFDKALNVK